MVQVSATVQSGYEASTGRYLEVSYLALCGCRWVVDMWGNVRSVTVCEKCCRVPLDRERQLSLLVEDE